MSKLTTSLGWKMHTVTSAYKVPFTVGLNKINHIQGSQIRLVRGLVKFVPAH